MLRPDKRRAREKLDQMEKALDLASKVAEGPINPKDLPEFRPWAKDRLWIPPREGGVIPWDIWHYGQERAADILEENRYSGESKVHVFGKPRQEAGLSTLFEAYGFFLGWHLPYRRFATCAQDDPAARNLHKYIQTFWDYFPEKDKRPLKGGKVLSDGLEFEAPHGSRIFVTTAGAPDALRSYSAHDILASEYASYPQPMTWWASVMGTWAGRAVWGLFIVESTSKRINDFYRKVRRAQNPNVQDWEFVFIRWMDEPRCWIEVAPGEILKLDERAAEYQKKHNLVPERMKWLLNKLSDFADSWELLLQEIPGDIEESFQFAGQGLFDAKLLNIYLDQIDPTKEKAVLPVFRGRIEFKGPFGRDVELVEDQYGSFWIWHHPEEDKTYYFGGDVGRGVGMAFTEYHILDEKGVLCALWRSNLVSTEDAAVVAFKIGLYYNECTLAVETNEAGETILKFLKVGHPEYPQTKGGYPHIYYDIKEDREVDKQTDRIGVRTSRKSRATMLTELSTDFRKGRIKPYAETVLMQMLGFTFDPVGGKLEQNHIDTFSGLAADDGIFALAIANKMRRLGPRETWFQTTKRLWGRVAPEFMKVG